MLPMQVVFPDDQHQPQAHDYPPGHGPHRGNSCSENYLGAPPLGSHVGSWTFSANSVMSLPCYTCASGALRRDDALSSQLPPPEPFSPVMTREVKAELFSLQNWRNLSRGPLPSHVVSCPLMLSHRKCISTPSEYGWRGGPHPLRILGPPSWSRSVWGPGLT